MPHETIQHIATVFPIDSEVLKPGRRVSIIREFGLNTSTHGIPGIARSRSTQNRLFWSISLLIFTGVMIYFVTQSILAYFQYPSQTSVSVIVEWPQAFPAVTVCNYSPLRYDRVIGPFFDYLQRMNLTNATNSTNFTYEQSVYIRDFLIYKLNRNETLYEFLYSLESMLMACDYNGMPCSATNFTWFITAQYGFCYTFNANLKNAAAIKQNSDNGGVGILNVRFYIHQHQYVPYLSYGSGMVVMVHDNAQLPAIELGAMLLSPGRHNRLTYTKKSSTFLPAPYSACNDKIDLRMQTMLNQYNGTDYGYSQYECFVPCIQAYTYEKCGCGNPFRWTARSVVLPGANKTIDIPFCKIENPCYSAAGSELMNDKSIWASYCPACTQECSTVDFAIKASSLLAPPAFLLNDIKKFVESSDVPLPVNWSTSWMTEIQSNYVSLEVAYETTRSEVYTEQAALAPVDVVSNVGGQTGLWIGVSFLSLMEIAEMLYRLLRHQFRSLRRAFRRRFRTQEPTE